MNGDSAHPISPKTALHSLLVPYAASCLIGGLLTDLAYWHSAEMMWADFSAWLISVGTVLAAIAFIVGLFDWLTGRLSGMDGPAMLQLLFYFAALVVSIFNTFIHSRDAWTSVVPWGVSLSAMAVLLLLLSCWMAWIKDPYRAGRMPA